MKRLFAAIKANPNENLLRVYNELKNNLSHEKINWVKPHNIHITLKFFGETAEEQVDDICNVLSDVSGRHTAFDLDMKNVGIFGSAYNPRVIWFGMDEGKQIEALAHDVLNTVEEIGFERDRQNFRPHLTVGRIKQIKDKQFFQKVLNQYKNHFLQSIPVKKFYLIESKLRPEGPVYTTIDEFSLR